MARSLPSDRILEIDIESIVERHEESLSKFCKHLGLKLHENMMHVGLSSNSLDRWKKDLSPAERDYINFGMASGNRGVGIPASLARSEMKILYVTYMWSALSDLLLQAGLEARGMPAFIRPLRGLVDRGHEVDLLIGLPDQETIDRARSDVFRMSGSNISSIP